MISHEVIVNLIGSITTQSGLTISAELDINLYPKAFVSMTMEIVELTKAAFHGEWNHIIGNNCSFNYGRVLTPLREDLN